MENHHCQWEIPLWVAMFNSYVSHYQKLPEGRSYSWSQIRAVDDLDFLGSIHSGNCGLEGHPTQPLPPLSHFFHRIIQGPGPIRAGKHGSTAKLIVSNCTSSRSLTRQAIEVAYWLCFPWGRVMSHAQQSPGPAAQPTSATNGRCRLVDCSRAHGLAPFNPGVTTICNW